MRYSVLKLLRNASSHLAMERRRNALTDLHVHATPNLKNMAEEDDKGKAPKLFGDGFSKKKAKERDGELKAPLPPRIRDNFQNPSGEARNHTGSAAFRGHRHAYRVRKYSLLEAILWEGQARDSGNRDTQHDSERGYLHSRQKPSGLLLTNAHSLQKVWGPQVYHQPKEPEQDCKGTTLQNGEQKHASLRDKNDYTKKKSTSERCLLRGAHEGKTPRPTKMYMY